MYDPTKPYKEQILGLIKETWETPYVSVKKGITEKKFFHPEYHHSDGIGTKGLYHWEQKTFKYAVMDALAMNLNDLLVVGATPYAVIDHLFLPEDDHEAILGIIKTLSEECKKRNIAITGGETAIHNNMKGMEMSITMLGFIKKPRENCSNIGDVLIGLESSGLHSNGFTKIREIFGEEYRKEFVKPTRDYTDIIFRLSGEYDIHNMVHITGGAFTKLKDILPRNSDVKINSHHKLKPQEIFGEICDRGVSDEEMYKIFNCGIGFVLFVGGKEAEDILREIEKCGIKSDIIGEIVKGNGKVRIKSKFSDKEIIY